MDLWQRFHSWPYQTRMYPAIKVITAAAPADSEWTRVRTRDVIRTLCWDRVRSYNRGIRSVQTPAEINIPKKPGPHKAVQDLAQNNLNAKALPETDEGQSDDDIQPLERAPKTVSKRKIPAAPAYEPLRPTNTRAVGLGPIHTGLSKKTVFPINCVICPSAEGPSFTLEESQNAQRLRGLSFESQLNASMFDDMFEVQILGKSHFFARDIEYEEFDNAIQCVLTVEETHMRCYRVTLGSKSAREWKPLEYADQFDKMVVSYADVGVEVGLQQKVDLPPMSATFINV